MKFFSANLESLRRLYLAQLQMLLSGEEQIAEALPRMIEAATDGDLRQGLASHLRETKGHQARLERMLRGATGEAKPLRCKAVAALLSEADEMLKGVRDVSVRDAALIAAGQRIEHYEMAAYGAVCHFAQILGESLDEELLEQTLKEEAHAERLLTRIADRENPYAAMAA